MEPVVDIEKVSQELILHCLRGHGIVRRNNVQFQKADVGLALLRVGEAFAGQFHYLYGQYGYEGFDPFHFGFNTIRICLHMTGVRSVLHTVLACAFITEYVSQFGRDRNCFYVTYVAYKCMRVILERWLGREHDQMSAAWLQFVTYLHDLNQRTITRPRHLRPIDGMFENENVRAAAVAVVESCSQIPDQDYWTTEEREYIISDIPEEVIAAVGNVPECRFCLHRCKMFVNACALQHRNAPNYSILV